MRAIRKRESAPGLALDEVPVPTPGPDEVLVRIEAASICGTDLHIRRWDQWSSERVEPPLTLGSRALRDGRRDRRAVRDVDEGDYVSAESHVTCGVVLPLPHRARRTCASRRRSSASTATAASPTTPRFRPRSSGATTARSSRPRSRACRSRSAMPSSRRRTQDLAGRAVAVLGCGPVGLFTIAIAKAFGAGRLFASDHVPFRMELARTLGADARRERGRGRGRARLVRRAERGHRRRRRVRDVRARCVRSRTRSGSSGTAATSSSSASRRGRRRSTSPSRSSSRT